MKNKLIAIGCGFLLALGVTSPILAEQNTQGTIEVVQREPTTLEKKQAFTRYAADDLREDYYPGALWCLERVLEQDPGYTSQQSRPYSYPSLEEIKELTEQVIDKNLTEEAMRPYLLYLATMIYQEERIEKALSVLKEMLDYPIKEQEETKSGLEENIEKQPAGFKKEFMKFLLAQSHEVLKRDMSFSYHTWMIYNQTLTEARSGEPSDDILEKTHQKMREQYRLKDNGEYFPVIDYVLNEIETEVFIIDSDLINKIIEAN